MNLAIALAQILIPLIPSIVGDVESLVNWISSIRSAAQQSGEWTPQMDGNFRAAVLAAGLSDPAFKPDPPLAASDTSAAPAPSFTSAQPQTNAPITDSGANAGTVDQTKTENTAVEAPAPYLPDGSKNPAFDHANAAA